jgi:hypothetical protein
MIVESGRLWNENAAYHRTANILLHVPKSSKHLLGFNLLQPKRLN